MRVNGMKTSVMVEAMRNIQIPTYIKGSSKMVKHMAKDIILGCNLVRFMMANG